MALLIPVLPEEITADWMTAALEAGGHLGGARVTNVTMTAIGAGRGFAGLTLRIGLEYDRAAPAAPASLVAKLPSGLGSDPIRDRLTALLYSNEILWYREMAAHCPVRVPRHYWGGIDAENGRFCLLLEDLGALSTRDQATSCDDDTARRIVRAAADIHARWWEQPELRTSTWLNQPEVQARLITFVYPHAWEPFWERLGSTLEPGFRPIGQRLCTEMARRRLEADLIALYHARLVEQGVTGYGFEQCMTDYKRGLLISMSIPVNGVLTILRAIPPEEPAARAIFDSVVQAGEALIAVVAERGVAAVMENDAASVLER